LFILAGLIFLIGILSLDGTETKELFILCLISCIVLVLTAILTTPFLEWKAYT